MRTTFVWIAALTVCLGCRTSSSSVNSPPVHPDEPTSFSIGRMFELVGFRPAGSEAAPSLVPPEVLRFGQVANAIVTHASALNVHDPPELTQQKAHAILESLQPWDTALAAVRSVGLMNDESANLLNRYVGQLRAEAQKLTQYLPSPQTIAAIQHLAGNLQSTVGPLVAMLAPPTEAR